MTPAERLLAAADLLDKRAGEATPGPWSAPGGPRYVFLDGFSGHDVDGPKSGFVARGTYWSDAQYIATMHPEVGKAQAAWLRESAADLIDTPGTWTQHTLCARFIGHPDEANRCRHYDPALRLAGLILGGAS